MRSDSTQRLRAFLAVSVLATATVSVAEDGLHARARAAYDAGKCDEALPLLQQVGAADGVSGPWLYRLYYCQREAGQPGARDTINRARAALETEFADKPDLETGFYLANAYRNAGKVSAAAEIAAQITARVESGKAPGPRTPMETFQLGKLYADQENTARAAELYATALDGLIVPGEPASPTVSWAARYLGERAWDAEDAAGVVRYYGLIDASGASVQDYDRLATALVRQGDYRAAAKAWFDALRLNPAGGDRPRYCAQLATQAAEIAPLPETAPDGRAWSELEGPELGEVLFEKAQFANETLASVAGTDLTNEQRLELAEQLNEARAAFVTAGLEAVVRGLPLRETAFQSGYAPLIFHRTRWLLPPPPRKGKGRWKRPAKADPPADGSEGS